MNKSTKQKQPFRFFRMSGINPLHHYFVVPASGKNTGRQVHTDSIGSTELQFCYMNWCLAELRDSNATDELTQAQFERAIGTRNWLAAYKRAHE